MQTNPVILLGVLGLAAFLIGLSKGGWGGMLGALITPMTALVLPPDRALGLLLPLLLFGDLFAVAAHWRRWDRGLVMVLIPGALLGVTVGTVMITTISPTALRRLLGLIVAGFVVYKLLEDRLIGRLGYTPRAWHTGAVGLLSGFASTLAHVGGPPVVAYLLLRRVAPAALVATTALFFMVLNIIKVPYYLYAQIIDVALLGRVVWILPLIPVGIWAGKWLVQRVQRAVFERALILLLAVSAALLLTR